MDLRTPLAKVKGLGTAHSGVHHWWMQRVTAVALIPLVIWFVILVIRASVNAETLISYLNHPFNAVTMILFIVAMLYHGCLGVQVIIEDYLHCPCGKIGLLTLVRFLTAATALAAILAVIYAHVATPMPIRKVEKEVRTWQQDFNKRLKAITGGGEDE
ncbi:MAG: succinate dehydrogenase [Rickettsiaceae bacterium]|jgi:succinate dehydrogenase / fumarate reductase membrane anchor subunit|nr:succinate dehydrogenase [Rickettsiaceae bacterium]